MTTRRATCLLFLSASAYLLNKEEPQIMGFALWLLLAVPASQIRAMQVRTCIARIWLTSTHTHIKKKSYLSPVIKQDRISLWHEQTARYASELRELKQQMVAQLENLDKEKEVLRGSLDSVGTRVDRVERELDYLETQNGAQPCVDVDDKLIEQQVTLVKEKQKAKYLKQSGEVTFFRRQLVKKKNNNPTTATKNTVVIYDWHENTYGWFESTTN